jgi:hypothetical protein
MNLGEILDRTLQIYRAKFLVFAGIAAIPALVMLTLEAINQRWWGLVPFPYSGRILLTLGQWTVYTAALYQLTLLLHLLVWPAVTDMTSKLYFGGPSALTAAALRGNARWRSWLWMAVANWALVLILPELVISGLFVAFYYIISEVVKVSEATEDWLMTDVACVAFAVGFLVFFWLSSSLFVAVPVKSLEGTTVGRSLRRSWTLSRGSRWRIISVRLALVLTGWLANLSILFVLNLVSRCIMIGFGVCHYYRNIYTGIGYLSAGTASTLVGPILPIVLTLIYYDQRIRLEGYDIERMMEAAGLNAPVTPASGDASAALAEATEGQA